MAIYEFMCVQCGYIFDERLKEPVEFLDCPKCLGKSQRRYTPPLVKYVGSGFYTTDKEVSFIEKNIQQKEE